MATGLKDEAIRQEVFEAMQEDRPPYASYVKTIIGGVVVRFLDPIRMMPDERILVGIPGEAEEDEIVIKVWSRAEDVYLRKNNKLHFEAGRLIPYTKEQKLVTTVNQISDEDIELILQKPFFTLKNKLEEFTSPTPVRRFLAAAERMNRPVGTVDYIKKCLAEMETISEPVSDTIDIEL
jgi:hypothetical protein